MPLTPRDAPGVPSFGSTAPGTSSTTSGGVLHPVPLSQPDPPSNFLSGDCMTTQPHSSPSINELLQCVLQQVKTSDEKISSFISSQLEANRSTDEKISTFIATQQITNREINDKLNQLQSIVDTVDRNSQRISDLEHSNAALSRQLDSLKVVLSNPNLNAGSDPRGPDKVSDKLIISSVPVNISISVAELVRNLFNVLGIPELMPHILAIREIKKSQPTAVRELPLTTSPRSTNSFIVSLTSVAVRDVVMSKLRIKRKLKLSEITDINSSHCIHVNELLPSATYKLLRRAKIVAAEKSFKYVWCSNGSVTVRREHGSPPILIRSFEDLDKLT